MNNALRARVCIGAALVLAVLRFWRVPFSSLAGWDQYLSNLPAVSAFQQVSLWQVYRETAAQAHSATSGWFPLGTLPLAFWLFGPSDAMVKIVQYLLVVVSVGVYAFVANKLLRSHWAALFAVVVTLCAFQFRTVHDPVVGTSLIEPFSAIPIFAAFAAWLYYRDCGNRLFLLFAAVLAGLSALTGTIGCGMMIVLCIIAIRSQPRAAGYVLASATIVAVGVVFLRGAPQMPWMHGGSYAWNVFAQLFAALPTSFRAVGNLPVAKVADLYAAGSRYIDDRFLYLSQIALGGWLVAIACSATAYLACARRAHEDRGARVDALIAGLGFLLVPAILLGRAAEWQSGLPLGNAFDGAYFEYFGVGLLAAFSVWRMTARGGSAALLVPSVAALAVFFVAYGNDRADAYVLEHWERLDEPRVRLVQALRAGMFSEIPQTAAIVPTDSMRFARGIDGDVANLRFVLYGYTRTRFRVEAATEGSGRPSAEAWVLDAPRNRGFEITLVRWDGGDANAPLANRAIGYTSLPEIADVARLVEAGVRRTVIRRGSRIIVEAQRLCGPVATDEVFAASTPTLEFGNGFYRAGPYGYEKPAPPFVWGTAYVRYYPGVFMDARGSFEITPSSCVPQDIDFAASVVGQAPSHLTVVTGGKRLSVPISQRPISLEWLLKAASRTPIRFALASDARVADWDPILFRYERDRPRRLRILFQVVTLAERLPHKKRKG